MNKNLIATLSIGWWADYTMEVACPSFREYARRVNADIHVITEKKINILPVHMERFQIYDMFDKYDRILWLDCDIVISPKCPDLFDIVPYNCLGAIPDCSSGEWNNDNYSLDIEAVQKELGDIGWSKGYFNVGVLALSKIHKEIFSYPQEATKMSDWFHDQLLINYRFQKMYLSNRSDFYKMDTKFNAMRLYGYNIGDNADKAYIWHFASHQKKANHMRRLHKKLFGVEP